MNRKFGMNTMDIYSCKYPTAQNYSIKRIAQFIFLLIISFVSGYTLCYFLPYSTDEHSIKLRERIAKEDITYKNALNKVSIKGDNLNKELLRLKKDSKNIKDENLIAKVKNKDLIIKQLHKVIKNKDDEIKILQNTVDIKRKSQEDFLINLNNSNRALARANNKGKILFGATVGLGVVTTALLGVVGVMVYLK